MATSVTLLAVIVLSLVFVGGDTASATSFNPTASASLADSTPGANSDIATTFNVDAPDSNFGAVISFTPSSFFVASDADVEDGAGVTFLASQATLGILNGPCSPSGLTPEFQMMDATTNTAGPTVTFEDDPDDAGTDGEIFEDDDGDTLPNGVEMYPDFLLRIFPGLTPRARYYGQTNVVGNLVALNFVLFEPGTTFPRTQGPAFETDPALGYPSVTVLQNLGDPAAKPTPGSTITDFCTPLRTTTTTCGVAQDKKQMKRSDPCSAPLAPTIKVRTNPDTDQTVNFLTYAASQPDADDDGLENGLDTCPYDPNVDDPRVDQGPDIDQIDGACDPEPNAQCGGDLPGQYSDCDNDGFPNAGDNCPLVANPDQANVDADGIGDACDRDINGPNTVDGHRHVVCRVTEVNVGAGGTAPPAPNVCTLDAVGIDLNGNGVFDSLEVTGPGEATPTPTPGPGAGTPTPTPAPGAATPTPGAGTPTAGGVGGGPVTGIGSLAPAASSISAWAAIASALGGAGLLGSLGAIASRILRRRRQ